MHVNASYSVWVILRETGTRVKNFSGLKADLTVNSRASVKRPLRLLWRKALELPVLDIRILAKRAFCKEQETIETTC